MAFIPDSAAILAISGPFFLSSLHPVRIFNVTGTSTASTTDSKMSLTSFSSFINADPANLLQTFFAGQPIFISIICAPLSAHNLAAFDSNFGSEPAICITLGSIL